VTILFSSPLITSLIEIVLISFLIEENFFQSFPQAYCNSGLALSPPCEFFRARSLRLHFQRSLKFQRRRKSLPPTCWNNANLHVAPNHRITQQMHRAIAAHGNHRAGILRVPRPALRGEILWGVAVHNFPQIFAAAKRFTNSATLRCLTAIPRRRFTSTVAGKAPISPIPRSL